MPGFDLDHPIIGKAEGPKLRRLQKYFSMPLAIQQGHPHLIEWLPLSGLAWQEAQMVNLAIA
jgi:hypothetical protein